MYGYGNGEVSIIEIDRVRYNQDNEFIAKPNKKGKFIKPKRNPPTPQKIEDGLIVNESFLLINEFFVQVDSFDDADLILNEQFLTINENHITIDFS